MADEEKPKLKTHQRPNVLALSLAALFNDTGSDMLFAFYPLFVFWFILGGQNLKILGLIESLALLAGLLIRPFMGVLADRKGRRHFIWSGYLALAISRFVQAFAQVWWHLLPPKALYEVGRGVRNPPRAALLADSVPQKERGFAFGLLQSMDTVGAVLGPFIGWGLFTLFIKLGLKDALPYRLVLAIAALPTAGSIYLVARHTREMRKFSQDNEEQLGSASPKPKPWQALGANRTLLVFTIISAAFSFWAVTENFMILAGVKILNVNRMNPAAIGAIIILYLSINITFAPSALIAGKLSDRIGRKPLLVASLVTLAALSIGFGFANRYWLILILFAAHGIYQGLLKPAQNAFVADLAPEGLRATVLGSYGMVVGLAAIPAPFIFGALWDWGEAGGLSMPWRLPFLLSGSFVGVCALLLAIFVRPTGNDVRPADS